MVLLQDYLRIDTTAETGSELAGARYLAEVLARDGIESEIIDMGGGRANLIAVLPGESDRRWSSTTTSTSTPSAIRRSGSIRRSAAPSIHPGSTAAAPST